MPPIPSSDSRPLFGGYALVAVTLAWIAGIALRPVGPLAAIPALVWLLIGLAACIAGLVFARWHRSTVSGIRRTLLAAAIILCALAFGAARATWADPTNAPDAISHLPMNTALKLRGDVAAEPDIRGGQRYLLVDVTAASRDGGETWQPASGRAEVTVYGPDDWFAPAYGDTLSLNGKLTPAHRGAPAGVLVEMRGARATILARGGNPLLATLFDLRRRLAEAIQRTLPEPEAALLIGILLGFKTPMLRTRLTLFTTTGTIHLVVPAGLKVAMLAEMAHRALRPLGHWPRLAGSLVAVALYAALGGGGPAALRAAIMGALLVLAGSLGRRYNVFTALALTALLMTASEPLLIYDAGFQLTTLATLGIPLLTPPLQRPLLAVLGGLGYGIGESIAESLAVTMAAQIGTLPVLALTFGEVSLIAPIANLLTVPLLAPLLVLGGLLAICGASGVALLGGVALALSWVVWPLLWYVNNAIALCASLPGAALAVAGLPLALAWGYYLLIVLGGWRLAPVFRRWRAGLTERRRHSSLSRSALVALLAIALLGAGGAAAPAVAAGTVAHLDFLAVGPGGAAILLRLPSGITVLLDGGPDGPTLESALAGHLPFWRHTLDLAILTDHRAGAIRGLDDAATHFTITRAVDAGTLHPTREYLAWRDAMTHAGATYTQVRQGDELRLDDTTLFTALAPPQTLYPSQQASTTASNDLILRLDTPGLRALLLGAADDYALDALAGSGESLSADVVELALVPGEALNLSGALGDVLRLAHPRLVVICDAPIAPDSATAQKRIHDTLWASDNDVAAALGALVYRTSEAGAISLNGDANGWSLGG
ncbi:MAG TPA: ComEC/Rec2 family competence protein [Ktedonobacterales bacterium]|nr:ComEC/Rec2 family competence protein [Ktedonobacterales bacterium]